MSAIDNAIRELSALGRQQDTVSAAAAAPVVGGVRNLSMTLPIGTRVLDLLSGEKGTVIDGKRESVIVPAT